MKIPCNACEYNKMEIWECAVKNPVKLERRTSWYLTLAKFWNSYRKTKVKSKLKIGMCAPSGTYGCNAVKLLKKVQ